MLSEQDYTKAIDKIAAIPCVTMNPAHLAYDVYLMGFAFPEKNAFEEAITRTAIILLKLVNGEIVATMLKRELHGWYSYHYQPSIGQGEKALCRVIFRFRDGGLDVLGFGHRFIPEDVYVRLENRVTGE